MVQNPSIFPFDQTECSAVEDRTTFFMETFLGINGKQFRFGIKF